jgi:dTDP-4-amino-4,6-dideoxygalactose transaminase
MDNWMWLKGPGDPEPEDLEPGDEFDEDEFPFEFIPDDGPQIQPPGPGSFKIPLFDLTKQYKDLVDDMTNSFSNLLFFGQFVGGEFLDQFEASFAGYHDSKYCVGVGSGTDALFLALKALGIGQGDEVIIPTNTFIATAYAVSHTGAKVRFCDVDPETYNIDPELLDETIGVSTRAVIPVHLYGQPCNMDEITDILKNRNIPLIEDCAQATGARWDGTRVGNFGEAGCFSFYPTKNLGGLAQGGAVTTNNPEIAHTVRSLGNMGRAFGSHTEYAYRGFNSRLDTINAMFLKRCLARLQNWNYARQEIANWYEEELKDFGAVKTPFAHDKARHVYHLYMIQCLNKKDRDGLKEFLAEKNISTGLYYSTPCHKQEVYKYEGGNYFPVAEHLADTLLALPIFPHLNRNEAEYICKMIKEYFSEKR